MKTIAARVVSIRSRWYLLRVVREYRLTRDLFPWTPRLAALLAAFHLANVIKPR